MMTYREMHYHAALVTEMINGTRFERVWANSTDNRESFANVTRRLLVDVFQNIQNEFDEHSNDSSMTGPLFEKKLRDMFFPEGTPAPSHAYYTREEEE